MIVSSIDLFFKALDEKKSLIEEESFSKVACNAVDSWGQEQWLKKDAQIRLDQILAEVPHVIRICDCDWCLPYCHDIL